MKFSNSCGDGLRDDLSSRARTSGRTALAVVIAQLLHVCGLAGVAHAEDLSVDSRTGKNSTTYFATPTGVGATVNVRPNSGKDGAFFQSLGTNGRSCGTCHAADQAMSISPPQIRERFQRSRGRDPLFAPVDGANCTNARRGDPRSHSLMLNNGLVRIGMPVPATAEFTISVVHDPYGCALVADPKTGVRTASVYRRPLPASNLSFLSAVMWDGRETVKPLDDGATFLSSLKRNLERQAINATLGHAQATRPPKPAQLNDIVQFELGLFTAQWKDYYAGRLDQAGGRGGPTYLANQEFYPLINDVLGLDPTGAFYDFEAMKLFPAWADGADAADSADWRRAARADIAEGERLFNLAPLNITTVRGLNDEELGENGIGPESPGSTCTTCHDTPNIASMSRPLLMDVGVSHSPRPRLEPDPEIIAGLADLDRPTLPLFSIGGCPNPFYPGQPVSFYTSDPGRALVTGLCTDLNRMKVPMLRGLAGRAPYFHNGSAADLRQVVDFYDKRFQMNLTRKQKEQMTAFLNSL